MTHRRGVRCRCMNVLFVCIVAFALAALTSNGNGLGARTIAGAVASPNGGLFDGSHANVSLAGLDGIAINDSSPIHTGLVDSPRKATRPDAMGSGMGSLFSAAPDIERIARAIAGVSVVSTNCAAPNTDHLPSDSTTDLRAETSARSLADCHRA